MRLVQSVCALAFITFAGCGGEQVGSDPDALNTMPGVCGPSDPRACDPADTKKTTVCHIPPGNPANEHTICVGNAAVPAHLAHGDYVGTCNCPSPTPPPSAGDGGASSSDGSSDTTTPSPSTGPTIQ